jgi:hypothetical protein
MTTAPPAGPAPDAPIAEFSNCHVGILGHLHTLAALPALLAQAAQARRMSAEAAEFFRDVILVHHQDEERELFPAVLVSALAGAERDQLNAIVDRLTREHREVEAAYATLEPALKAAARGEDAALDATAVAALVARYQGHAGYEEQVFLPLAQRILGRNGDHMAALGLSLHLRHTLPDLLSRFGSRI